ncbi:phage tail protein [Escherichia coli]|uniref:phage tail protein n=1 Tax=Escherichia coli TaxID=562 RepID=UPI000BE3D984|nr:phage tail protein [Escherichia coli]
MTAKYFAILTNQGAARLANAAALGTKLNLTQMAVGDANGTLPTPDPAQTKLINQKRIAPLNLLTVDPANTSQIIAEQIIPENEGGFWIREIGIYDDDGILIAVANCPETYKPQLQEGSGRTQTIRMILIVSSTSSITLKIDPSVVLATRKYADDKAIELKLYVDDLMSKHLAAADPHSQYATKDSPTFTGKPKAPTPPVVANDKQVATAEFVQAVIAALVSGELANKQPLDKTLTDLSGKDVAAILEYLGLKEAAQRDVGTDINQIPDMSAWDSGSNWRRTPDGFIEVWGDSSVTNTSTGIAVATFPVPFPNECLSVMINEVTNVASGISGVKSWGLARDTISKTGVSAILNVTGSPAAGEFFVYRAIGR